MHDPIYVLIVDDEEFFRETLKTHLSTYEDIAVVATAANGEEALRLLEKAMVDVVLCDVRMPLMDGVVFTKIVAERNLPCKILALTSFNDGQAMLTMLEYGAFGFLIKGVGRADISTAIKAAVAGGTTISPESATKLRNYISRPKFFTETLPDREEEVLKFLHLGKSNRDIADELKISANSVKKAVSRLMQRFNATSRLELVAATRIPRP